MNYIRRAAAYIPYFSSDSSEQAAAPAGTNNATRRNRPPVAAANIPAVAAETSSVAAGATGGGSAAAGMGIVQRMKMQKEAEIAKAAANKKEQNAREATLRAKRNAAAGTAINWSSPEAVRRATAAAAFANIQHSKNLVQHVEAAKIKKSGELRRRRATRRTRKAGRR